MTKYHDPFGNPIYVYVRVGDKTVAIKADDLQKALDYVTKNGEEVTIEGNGGMIMDGYSHIELLYLVTYDSTFGEDYGCNIALHGLYETMKEAENAKARIIDKYIETVAFKNNYGLDENDIEELKEDAGFYVRINEIQVGKDYLMRMKEGIEFTPEIRLGGYKE